jgi:transcriptional regulator with XRE-family HTH domain
MNGPRAREFARLLKAAGWSQAEAARRLQLTRGAVSQILSGRTNPRASTLNLLRLLARDQSAAPPEATVPMQEWERQFLDQIRDLPADRRKQALELIRDLAPGSGHPSPTGRRRPR